MFNIIIKDIVMNSNLPKNWSMLITFEAIWNVNKFSIQNILFSYKMLKKM